MEVESQHSPSVPGDPVQAVSEHTEEELGYIEEWRKLLRVARGYEATGDFARGLAVREQMLIAAKRGFGDSSVEVEKSCESFAIRCNQTAMACLQNGQLDRSFDLLRKAEIITDKNGLLRGCPTARLRCRAVTLNNLGLFYKHRGENHAALTYLEQALEIESGTADAHSENPAATLLNMCAVLSKLGRHQVALKLGFKALGSLKKRGESAARLDPAIGPSLSAMTAVAHHAIGCQYEGMGCLQKAAEHYALALIDARSTGDTSAAHATYAKAYREVLSRAKSTGRTVNESTLPLIPAESKRASMHSRSSAMSSAHSLRGSSMDRGGLLVGTGRKSAQTPGSDKRRQTGAASAGVLLCGGGVDELGAWAGSGLNADGTPPDAEQPSAAFHTRAPLPPEGGNPRKPARANTAGTRRVLAPAATTTPAPPTKPLWDPATSSPPRFARTYRTPGGGGGVQPPQGKPRSSALAHKPYDLPQPTPPPVRPSTAGGVPSARAAAAQAYDLVYAPGKGVAAKLGARHQAALRELNAKSKRHLHNAAGPPPAAAGGGGVFSLGAFPEASDGDGADGAFPAPPQKDAPPGSPPRSGAGSPRSGQAGKLSPRARRKSAAKPPGKAAEADGPATPGRNDPADSKNNAETRELAPENAENPVFASKTAKNTDFPGLGLPGPPPGGPGGAKPAQKAGSGSPRKSPKNGAGPATGSEDPRRPVTPQQQQQQPRGQRFAAEPPEHRRRQRVGEDRRAPLPGEPGGRLAEASEQRRSKSGEEHPAHPRPSDTPQGGHHRQQRSHPDAAHHQGGGPLRVDTARSGSSPTPPSTRGSSASLAKTDGLGADPSPSHHGSPAGNGTPWAAAGKGHGLGLGVPRSAAADDDSVSGSQNASSLVRRQASGGERTSRETAVAAGELLAEVIRSGDDVEEASLTLVHSPAAARRDHGYHPVASSQSLCKPPSPELPTAATPQPPPPGDDATVTTITWAVHRRPVGYTEAQPQPQPQPPAAAKQGSSGEQRKKAELLRSLRRLGAQVDALHEKMQLSCSSSNPRAPAGGEPAWAALREDAAAALAAAAGCFSRRRLRAAMAARRRAEAEARGAVREAAAGTLQRLARRVAALRAADCRRAEKRGRDAARLALHAVGVQSAVRCLLAARAAGGRRAALRGKSATAIQRRWRGCAARAAYRLASARRQEKLKVKQYVMATQIQSWWRAKRAQQQREAQFKREWEELVHEKPAWAMQRIKMWWQWMRFEHKFVAEVLRIWGEKQRQKEILADADRLKELAYSSCMVIQQAYRCYLARRRVEHLQIRDLTRKIAYLESEERAHASTVLQAFNRVVRAKRDMHRRRREIAEFAALEAWKRRQDEEIASEIEGVGRQHKAALRLQLFWRRRRARLAEHSRRVRELEAWEGERYQPATAIAAWWKAHACRRTHGPALRRSRHDRMARVIQRACWCFLARRESRRRQSEIHGQPAAPSGPHQREIAAAGVIGRWYRGLVAHREAADRLRAMREAKDRMQDAERRDAVATMIQCQWRGHLHRRTATREKAAAAAGQPTHTAAGPPLQAFAAAVQAAARSKLAERDKHVRSFLLRRACRLRASSAGGPAPAADLFARVAPGAIAERLRRQQRVQQALLSWADDQPPPSKGPASEGQEGRREVSSRGSGKGGAEGGDGCNADLYETDKGACSHVREAAETPLLPADAAPVDLFRVIAEPAVAERVRRQDRLRIELQRRDEASAGDPGTVGALASSKRPEGRSHTVVKPRRKVDTSLVEVDPSSKLPEQRSHTVMEPREKVANSLDPSSKCPEKQSHTVVEPRKEVDESVVEGDPSSKCSEERSHTVAEQHRKEVDEPLVAVEVDLFSRIVAPAVAETLLRRQRLQREILRFGDDRIEHAAAAVIQRQLRAAAARRLAAVARRARGGRRAAIVKAEAAGCIARAYRRCRETRAARGELHRRMLEVRAACLQAAEGEAKSAAGDLAAAGPNRANQRELAAEGEGAPVLKGDQGATAAGAAAIAVGTPAAGTGRGHGGGQAADGVDTDRRGLAAATVPKEGGATVAGAGAVAAGTVAVAAGAVAAGTVAAGTVAASPVAAGAVAAGAVAVAAGAVAAGHGHGGRQTDEEPKEGGPAVAGAPAGSAGPDQAAAADRLAKDLEKLAELPSPILSCDSSSGGDDPAAGQREAAAARTINNACRARLAKRRARAEQARRAASAAGREDAQRKGDAAVALQSAFRSYRQRQAFARVRKRHRAAAALQRLYLLWSEVRYCSDLRAARCTGREATQREEAACAVQRAVRQWLSRARLLARLSARKSMNADRRRCESAAVISEWFHRCARKQSSRVRYQEAACHRAETARRVDAATTIQAFVRGCKARVNISAAAVA
ncbi:hypothetical protein DIPPA_14611 [Diplonema papillatum]|nr:hypothetical protein DIPPA_14611 [Diplonema papillatum]